MSGKVTRIDLNQAGNGQTDWAALGKLSEVQIDARALLDPDTLLPSAQDLGFADDGLMTRTSVQFQVWKDKAGEFRWSLGAADGALFAISPQSFATKALALDSLRGMLAALGNVDQLAA